MKELKKTQSNMFNEYFEGVAVSGARVVCILDDYCVRYMVFNHLGERVSRREFKNANKELCFKRATEALNKI